MGNAQIWKHICQECFPTRATQGNENEEDWGGKQAASGCIHTSRWSLEKPTRSQWILEMWPPSAQSWWPNGINSFMSQGWTEEWRPLRAEGKNYEKVTWIQVFDLYLHSSIWSQIPTVQLNSCYMAWLTVPFCGSCYLNIKLHLRIAVGTLTHTHTHTHPKNYAEQEVSIL